MKAKLIKIDNTIYNLENEKGILIGSTFEFKTDVGDNLHRLSFKNCEAIANGYDLDELVQESISQKKVKKDSLSFDEQVQRSGGFIVGFKEGFNKAMEILSGKKFSEDDVKDMFQLGFNLDNPISENEYNTHIQSLQQTEWEVIVEMECCGNYSSPCNINCEYGPKPKLVKIVT